MDLRDLRDLDRFLATVKIETDGEPMAWSEVADDWQKEALAGIAPAFTRLVHERAPAAEKRRAFWVRPRGHAKTADASLLVTWVLAFSARRRRGVWIAADKDQGCEGLDSIATLIQHNPWLKKLLTVKRDSIENKRTGSVMYFSTSDVTSAFAWKDVDLFCLDELTHWRTQGEELWDAMFSSFGKRKNAILMVLMNAGWNETFQRKLRDTVATDSAWQFHELPDAVASWIDQDRIREQNKYVSELAFNRLWRNHWVDGTEGEALDPVLVNRCFSPRTSRHICPDRGWSYIGGLDIGISRNASAFAVVAVRRGFDGHGEFQLADLDVWTPLLGERVNLSQVEAAIARAHERYHLADCRFDPFQAAHLASRLASGQVAVPSKQLGRLAAPGSRIRMTEVSFTTANLSKMASVLVQAITDGRFSSYCDHVTEQLRRDLLAVRLIERPYGSRLEFPTQADRSHGDAGTATVLAMLGASELAAKRVVTAGAGGFGVGHSSLADMNEEVWRREQERIATVQSELEQRMREIRDFPKHQDHPLWRALYRAGSPRVC